MSKIYAVQGDSLPLVTLTITDLDDNLVSIAGCTGANAYMRKLGETATLTFLWPRIMLRTMMGCEVALQKSV